MYLTALDAYVGNCQCGTATKSHPGVAFALDGSGHADLDVLQVGALGNTPPQSDKRLVARDVGCVEYDVFEADGKR